MVAGVRAQAQAALGGDAALDAFTEFRDQVTRVEDNAKRADLRKVLDKWKDVPAIHFAPVAPLGKTHVPRKVPMAPEKVARLLRPVSNRPVRGKG